MRRQVPLFITFFVCSVMPIAHFMPPLERLSDHLTTTFNILAAFAFILGAGNLVTLHTGKMFKQEAGWAYSGVTLAGFFVMLIVGLAKIGGPDGFSAYVRSR